MASTMYNVNKMAAVFCLYFDTVLLEKKCCTVELFQHNLSLDRFILNNFTDEDF